MNCLLLVLYLMSLLDSVLSSLPAPVNVSVSSVNFHHVLGWDPGPGTPPGTHYKISMRVRKKKWEHNSTTTSIKLKLDNIKTYYLTVQASYNQTLSPESHKVNFMPIKDTIIGPPKLSLAGCGTCIQINMSLPEADRSSGILDIQKLYDAKFRVSWRKCEGVEESRETQDKSFTLSNLEKGVEYCVQVQTKMRLNKNTEPSAWHCSFTSFIGPSRGPIVLGTVAAFLVIVICVLTTSMFCLHYTGLLCKLKAALPRPLMDALSQGYTLTPERAIPDHISISSDNEKQRKHHNRSTAQPATKGSNSEEEDEEEEEGVNVYKDRDAELSSCQICADLTGNRVLAASGDCGSCEVENEVRGLDQDASIAAGAGGVAERGDTAVQGHVTTEEEEEKQEGCESLGNVNLFSVTLAALAVCEEEEEVHNTRDSPMDILKLSDLEPSPNIHLKWTNTDSQSESDMLPTTEEMTAAGYEGSCANTGCLTSFDGEETQEEEEFSGYMGRT